MSNVLVTGGGGFIGSNLTEALLKKGHAVRVLDNFSTGKRENLAFDRAYPSPEIVEGDISHSGLCPKAMEGRDYVFHQAALPSVQSSVEDPLASNTVNVEGTLNILLAARQASVKRVIYASSCAIYGENPVLPKEEGMAPEPLSPYALQKYVGEEYGRLFFQLYGLETISLRYFNVFGPRQDPDSLYSAVIPKFIKALVTGQSPVIYGDGDQSRDFIYIENVVQANLLAMSAERAHGEVINVASGVRTSVNQLLDILRGILGAKVSPIYQDPRPGDIKHSVADIQRAKQFLKYDPPVGIEAGLEKTADYFKHRLFKGKGS